VRWWRNCTSLHEEDIVIRLKSARWSRFCSILLVWFNNVVFSFICAVLFLLYPSSKSHILLSWWVNYNIRCSHYFLLSPIFLLLHTDFSLHHLFLTNFFEAPYPTAPPPTPGTPPLLSNAVAWTDGLGYLWMYGGQNSATGVTLLSHTLLPCIFFTWLFSAHSHNSPHKIYLVGIRTLVTPSYIFLNF
jgi:hypothetical protein